MTVLLLRLQGPMQSWGTQSRFRDRDTGREPSKSGVIGLLCAALGRPRWEPVDDLASLTMGVRIDREGVLQADYHTAQQPGERNAIISPRMYLADAVFLVGLEGDRQLLAELDEAVPRPYWQICLGRKAFPPAEPVCLPNSMREEGLDTALRSYPLLYATQDRRRRFVIEDPRGTEVRQDVPLSFAERRYSTRRVRTDWKEVEASCISPA